MPKNEPELYLIKKLMRVGFEMDEFGALVAKGCMVTLYREADRWAFDCRAAILSDVTLKAWKTSNSTMTNRDARMSRN
jgi:hypothetical protein